MKPPIEFYFDCMSPFSYLASTRVEEVAKRAGTRVQWKPVHLPGIIKATGNKTPIHTPAKGAHMMKDLNDWTEFLKLPSLKTHDMFGTVSMALPNRVTLVCAETGHSGAFARAHLWAMYAEGKDGNDVGLIASELKAIGADSEAVLEAANSEPVKALYRAETDKSIARGLFGVPTFFVGDEMFVGNDRLDFVERCVARFE